MEACDRDCANLGIPSNLHTLDRRPGDEFRPEEMLHIRIPKSDGNDYSDAFLREFRCQNQSANRGKFSAPTDVLFNIKSETHFFASHVVLSVTVGAVLAISCPNEGSIQHDKNTKAVIKSADVYRFLVKHVPEKCMFPHSEFILLKNGIEFTGDFRSKTTKSALRKAMWVACQCEQRLT